MSMEALTHVFRNSKQSGAAHTLLVAIADSATVEGECRTYSNSKLAHKARITKRYLPTLTSKLEAAGEIAVYPFQGEETPHGRMNLYVVLGMPGVEYKQYPKPERKGGRPKKADEMNAVASQEMNTVTSHNPVEIPQISSQEMNAVASQEMNTVTSIPISSPISSPNKEIPAVAGLTPEAAMDEQVVAVQEFVEDLTVAVETVYYLQQQEAPQSKVVQFSDSPSPVTIPATSLQTDSPILKRNAYEIAVEFAWDNAGLGKAMLGQLFGTAKKGKRAEFNLDPPVASAAEIVGFGIWKRRKHGDKFKQFIPKDPETVQDNWLEFRGERNHTQLVTEGEQHLTRLMSAAPQTPPPSYSSRYPTQSIPIIPKYTRTPEELAQIKADGERVRAQLATNRFPQKVRNL